MGQGAGNVQLEADQQVETIHWGIRKKESRCSHISHLGVGYLGWGAHHQEGGV